MSEQIDMAPSKSGSLNELCGKRMFTIQIHCDGLFSPFKYCTSVFFCSTVITGSLRNCRDFARRFQSTNS